MFSHEHPSPSGPRRFQQSSLPAALTLALCASCSGDPASQEPTAVADPAGTREVDVAAAWAINFATGGVFNEATGPILDAAVQWSTNGLAQLLLTTSSALTNGLGIADVGAVQGVGAITAIPGAFQSTVVALPGRGYVVRRADNTHARVFVSAWAVNSAGAKRGVRLKWQWPFNPTAGLSVAADDCDQVLWSLGQIGCWREGETDTAVTFMAEALDGQDAPILLPEAAIDARIPSALGSLAVCAGACDGCRSFRIVAEIESQVDATAYAMSDLLIELELVPGVRITRVQVFDTLFDLSRVAGGSVRLSTPIQSLGLPLGTLERALGIDVEVDASGSSPGGSVGPVLFLRDVRWSKPAGG